MNKSYISLFDSNTNVGKSLGFVVSLYSVGHSSRLQVFMTKVIHTMERVFCPLRDKWSPTRPLNDKDATYDKEYS